MTSGIKTTTSGNGSVLPFPENGSALGAQIRFRNWSQTPVGDMAGWPNSLRKTLEMILSSRFPMMIFWGPEGIQFYNDAFCSILQDSDRHPRALGQAVRDCWPQNWADIKPSLFSAQMGGDTIWIEDQPLPFLPSDGAQDLLWTYSYHPIKDETGKTGGVLLICNETMDKLRIQQIATQNERNFRTLVEESPIATAIIRMPEMKLELANEAMLQSWGKDKSVLGQKVLEFLPELQEQGFGALFSQVYQTGKTYIEKGGKVQMQVNGMMRTAYLDYTMKALRDINGLITGILVTGLDVTEQVIATMQLEHSERSFRDLICQVPVPVTVLRGGSYIIELANNKMLQLWGKTLDEVVGKPFLEVFPEVKQAGTEQRLDQVFYSGEPLIGSAHPLTFMRNGKKATIYVNYEYDAIRELDGIISGIIATATDVTEQVKTRETIEAEVAERTSILRLANGQLQKTNNSLEHFAGMVSRDLRVPVQKILAHSEILKKRYRWDLGQEGSMMIDRMQAEADHVLVLFDDLLKYASIPSQVNNRQTVHPGPIITALLKDMDPAIQEQEALVAIGNLHPMKGDSLQLMMLFRNLLDNALKFSRKDHLPDISISSRLETGRSSGMAVIQGDEDRHFQLIEFTDNGIGFEQQHADKIFELFQRLHKPEQYPGNGIGLAIARKIVHSHNGYMAARSKPGKGATFSILLPMNEEHR